MCLKLMPDILANNYSTGCGARRRIVVVSEFAGVGYKNPTDCDIRARPKSLQVSRSAALAEDLEPQVIVEIALSSS
jgi:hypothetical protein